MRGLNNSAFSLPNICMEINKKNDYELCDENAREK